MFFKEPKNDENILWTKHAKEKMGFYQLSERRLKKVLRNPDRKEKGIAPQTIAVMQRAGSKKNPYEIWLMYQLINSRLKAQNSKRKGKRIKIISAWRYPGVSPIGEAPIPQDILEDLKNLL